MNNHKRPTAINKQTENLRTERRLEFWGIGVAVARLPVKEKVPGSNPGSPAKGTYSNLIQAEDFVNFVAIFVPCIFENYGEVRSTEGEAALKAVTDKTDVGS